MNYCNEQYLSSYFFPLPQFFFSPSSPCPPPFSPDVLLCAEIIWPHDKLMEWGFKSWRLSLINQALPAEGIVGKVSDFCFVSFTQKHFCYWKNTLEKKAASRDCGRKNAKNIFMKFCVCQSCFRCCPSCYSVWHAVCISIVICYPVEVECLLCFVYLPPWCPHHLCSGR